MSEIIFKRLRSGVAFDCDLNFKDGRFIEDISSKSLIPNKKPARQYKNVEGIALDVDLSKFDSIQELATLALEKVEEIFAHLSAKYQTHVYLDLPITFTLEGKEYIFHELWVEELEQFNKTHFCGGGGGFCNNLKFLNKKRSSRLIFDFYKEAQNECKPMDYRALQLWRFFEGWFKLKDKDLKNKLLDLKFYETKKGYSPTGKVLYKRKKIAKKLINGLYSFMRCAVSHGGASKGKESKKIIIPRRAVFDDWLMWHFHEAIDIASYILRKNTR